MQSANRTGPVHYHTAARTFRDLITRLSDATAGSRSVHGALKRWPSAQRLLSG